MGRKFGYLCIQEILVTNKIVRTYVGPLLHVNGCEMSYLLSLKVSGIYKMYLKC